MQVFMSVIICTFNRARLLRRTLRSLARQTTGPDGFEVVVVDDGSDDDTAGVCRDILRGFANSQYIPSAGMRVWQAPETGGSGEPGVNMFCLLTMIVFRSKTGLRR